MARISPKAVKVIKTLESLACRFEALSLSGDVTAKKRQFDALQRFAAEWMSRSGIHVFHRIYDEDHWTDESIADLWRSFLEAVKIRFPIKAPSSPSGRSIPGLENVNSEDFLCCDTELSAFTQGDACRWVAWLISEGHWASVSNSGRKKRKSKNDPLVEFAKKNADRSYKEIARLWNAEHPNSNYNGVSVQKAVSRHDRQSLNAGQN